MAIGLLFWAFIIMSVFALACTILLFLLKKSVLNDIFLVLMGVYALCIASLGAGAQPENYVFRQVLAWAVGLVGAGSVAARFITKKQRNLFRILVAGSVIVGIILLFLV